MILDQAFSKIQNSHEVIFKIIEMKNKIYVYWDLQDKYQDTNHIKKYKNTSILLYQDVFIMKIEE